MQVHTLFCSQFSFLKKICAILKNSQQIIQYLINTIVPEGIILVTGRDLQQNQGQEGNHLSCWLLVWREEARKKISA